MFYSNELLHLVFADETDTYYYNGLLELDLKQLLWFELHRKYRSVYYLDVDGDDLRVLHYGDSAAKSYDDEKSKKKLLFGQKSRAERLGAWLEDRLQGKNGERAAIVCPLKTFCGYFDENENRIAILRRLASMEHRTGILVLTAPPEAEDTRDLFLHSPVFGPQALDESSVMMLREMKECRLYHTLSEMLGERCTYLNVYTEERLRQIVRRLLLADPKKCGACTDPARPAEYLFQCMNNEPFRLAEEAKGLRLPKSASVTFRQLYDHFTPARTWEKLTARLEAVEQANGLAAYCAENGLPLYREPQYPVGVRHRSNSCAAHCLQQLKLPEGEPDPAFADAGTRLKEIRDAVSDPQNRDENPKIVAAVERFLGDMHSVRSAGDAATQYRVLEAVSFCVKWMYAKEKSEDEEKALRLIDMLNTYVSLSSQYFSYCQIDSGAAQTVATKKMLDSLEYALRETLKQVSLPTKDSLEKFAHELREFEKTGSFKSDGVEFEFEESSAFAFRAKEAITPPAPNEVPADVLEDAFAEEEDLSDEDFDDEPTEDDFDIYK